jgi:hypothetical protein
MGDREEKRNMNVGNKFPKKKLGRGGEKDCNWATEYGMDCEVRRADALIAHCKMLSASTRRSARSLDLSWFNVKWNFRFGAVSELKGAWLFSSC